MQKKLMALMALIATLTTGQLMAAGGRMEGHAGLALPIVGDLEDVADPGFAIGAECYRSVSSQHEVGIGVDYLGFGEDSMSNVDIDVDMISLLALTRYRLAGGSQASPYILGGAGITHTDLNVTNPGGSPLSGSVSNDMSPSFLIGAGFDMPMGNGMFVGFGARYQQTFFKIADIKGGGTFSVLGNLRW